MNWLRLGAIAALVLGSIYVLLPTALQDESDAQVAAFQERAGLEEQTGQLPLTVTRGNRDEVLAALVQRLKVAGVTVDGIDAEGDDDIIIEPGETPTDAITGLIGGPVDAAVVDLNDLEVEPAADDALGEAVTTALTEAKVSEADVKRLAAVTRAGSLDEPAFGQLTSRPAIGLAVDTTDDATTLTAVLAPSADATSPE
ncbi:MAG: hypothetical protein AAF211_08195, partial [Myxococcota bacterium]